MRRKKEQMRKKKKTANNSKEDKINTQETSGKEGPHIGNPLPAAVYEHQRPDITPVHSLAMHASSPLPRFPNAPPSVRPSRPPPTALPPIPNQPKSPAHACPTQQILAHLLRISKVDEIWKTTECVCARVRGVPRTRGTGERNPCRRPPVPFPSSFVGDHRPFVCRERERERRREPVQCVLSVRENSTPRGPCKNRLFFLSFQPFVNF